MESFEECLRNEHLTKAGVLGKGVRTSLKVIFILRTFIRASNPSRANKYNFNNRISGTLPDVGDILDNHPDFT